MFEKRSEPGEYIIRQGDDGDNFYVIENGNFDVLVTGDDGVEKVKHLNFKKKCLHERLHLAFSTNNRKRAIMKS